MTQLGIPLSQLASKDFQEVLRLSGALPTRWSPRQLNVHRWHLIKSTTIYPRLCEMVDLLKITEPELLEKLYVTPLAGYIFIGVHNSSSLYSVQDVTGGALRALTKKSAENVAQVATTMHTGSVNGRVWTASLPPVTARVFFEADAKTARAGVPLTGPVPPVKTAPAGHVSTGTVHRKCEGPGKFDLSCEVHRDAQVTRNISNRLINFLFWQAKNSGDPHYGGRNAGCNGNAEDAQPQTTATEVLLSPGSYNRWGFPYGLVLPAGSSLYLTDGGTSTVVDFTALASRGLDANKFLVSQNRCLSWDKPMEKSQPTLAGVYLGAKRRHSWRQRDLKADLRDDRSHVDVGTKSGEQTKRN
ncbi:hypothetical protein C8R45DRAFT_936801 [Mycena sanguinolenta]|nr:hypothetical protein C8R45DRAFT_936801 [Mycena sanguinolenta]